MVNKNSYTVAELNLAVRDLLEQQFDCVYVQGEISNFVCPASGHWYFSLKDDKAQIRCAMFSRANRNVPFHIEEGMQMQIFARVSLYTPRGDYQLIVESLEEIGDGALRRAFEQLKQTLAKQGLFAAKHKQVLPKFPRAIGVVTSSSGAALHDIINVLRRRCPLIPIIVYPTLVQGEAAAANIATMIKTANTRRECDVLIIGRGGGSLEDLWAFNEEIVARAIYASKIPTVSAVGHEVDITIADLVADQRAATPSVAAELVSPDSQEWQGVLLSLHRRLWCQLWQILKQKQQALIWLRKRLRHPQQQLQERAQRLDYLWQILVKTQQQLLAAQRQRIINCSHALDTMSPLATLDRGYTILQKSHVIVTTIEQVQTHDKISARVSNGVIDCIVSNVDKV